MDGTPDESVSACSDGSLSYVCCTCRLPVNPATRPPSSILGQRKQLPSSLTRWAGRRPASRLLPPSPSTRSTNATAASSCAGRPVEKLSTASTSGRADDLQVGHRPCHLDSSLVNSKAQFGAVRLPGSGKEALGGSDRPWPSSRTDGASSSPAPPTCAEAPAGATRAQPRGGHQSSRLLRSPDPG